MSFRRASTIFGTSKDHVRLQGRRDSGAASDSSVSAEGAGGRIAGRMQRLSRSRTASRKNHANHGIPNQSPAARAPLLANPIDYLDRVVAHGLSSIRSRSQQTVRKVIEMCPYKGRISTEAGVDSRQAFLPDITRVVNVLLHIFGRLLPPLYHFNLVSLPRTHPWVEIWVLLLTPPVLGHPSEVS